MENKINGVIRNLKIQFYLFWALPLLLVVLFETDLLPVGIYADSPEIQFVLENIGILVAIISVPLALKLFSIILKKKIDKQESLIVALGKYQFWSGMRLLILEVAVVFNIIIYYFTLNSAGGLCALIGLAASFFCYPSRKRLQGELFIENDEE